MHALNIYFKHSCPQWLAVSSCAIWEKGLLQTDKLLSVVYWRMEVSQHYIICDPGRVDSSSWRKASHLIFDLPFIHTSQLTLLLSLFSKAHTDRAWVLLNYTRVNYHTIISKLSAWVPVDTQISYKTNRKNSSITLYPVAFLESKHIKLPWYKTHMGSYSLGVRTGTWTILIPQSTSSRKINLPQKSIKNSIMLMNLEVNDYKSVLFFFNQIPIGGTVYI